MLKGGCAADAERGKYIFDLAIVATEEKLARSFLQVNDLGREIPNHCQFYRCRMLDFVNMVLHSSFSAMTSNDLLSFMAACGSF